MAEGNGADLRTVPKAPKAASISAKLTAAESDATGAEKARARGKSGLCAAHTSMVQERENKKNNFGVGIGIGPGLFHGLVPAPAPASTIVSSFENTYSSSGVSIVSDSIDSLEKPAKRQQMIPPQVLVPPSMKSQISSSFQMSIDGKQGGGGGESGNRSELVVPEGRVHGGGLLSLLGGNLKNASIDGV